MTNTAAPVPTATRFVRTLAKRHGLSTAAVVAIARDIDLAVILRPTGGGAKTEWVIDEPPPRIAMFADRLATLTAASPPLSATAPFRLSIVLGHWCSESRAAPIRRPRRLDTKSWYNIGLDGTVGGRRQESHNGQRQITYRVTRRK